MKPVIIILLASVSTVSLLYFVFNIQKIYRYFANKRIVHKHHAAIVETLKHNIGFFGNGRLLIIEKNSTANNLHKKSLQQELQKAIDEQDFDKAAKIRDFINELNNPTDDSL